MPATSVAAPVSVIPPLEWVSRSIRHRPLLWMAPALAIGCAIGPQFAWVTRATEHNDARLLWPLLSAVVGIFGMFVARRHALGWRLFLALMLCSLGALYSARRVLVPPNNIASLVQNVGPAATAGPIAGVDFQLWGWVAAPPQRSDFFAEFPLQCRILRFPDGRQMGGRVWIRLPLEARVEVGDEVILNAELRDLPRVGTPGERTRNWSYLLENCWCRGRVKDVSQIRVLRRDARYPLQRLIVDWRRRLVRHYERAFAGTHASAAPAPPFPYATAQLVAAMVFGEGGLTEPLPRLTREQFRVAGLSHLIVASGAQISLAVLGLLGLARFVGLRRWWIVLVVVPVLLTYILLAGGSASIWRAGIAALCVTCAILLGREADGVSLWSLALAALLLVDPLNLFDLSFQLTFAATWGLLCLSPLFLGWLQRGFGDSPTIQVAAMTIAAQVATLPLILYHFGQLSIVGFGCNLLGVPVAGLLVATGIAGLWLPIINPLNYHLAHAITAIAAAGSQLPGAQYHIVLWPLSRMILSYVLLGCLALLPLFTGFDWKSWREAALEEWQRRRQRQNARPLGWRIAEWGILPGTIVVVLVLWQTLARDDGKLHVAVLDVGQGESLVIKSPSGRVVLIDGGSISLGEHGEVGRSVIVPYLQYIGASKIDVMVVTHADIDHCNALENVLREVPVGQVIDGATAGSGSLLSPEYQAFKRALALRNVPSYSAKAGQRLDLGEGVTLRVLWPRAPSLPGDNNNAAVLRLDYKNVGMLFTADIEAAAEERLLQSGENLRCQVLKVAHHGSQTSSSAAFLAATQPRSAIISCGRYNSFGHPSPQVLRRLDERHIPVFRTDLDGTIEITSDGRTCSLKPFR